MTWYETTWRASGRMMSAKPPRAAREATLAPFATPDGTVVFDMPSLILTAGKPA